MTNKLDRALSQAKKLSGKIGAWRTELAALENETAALIDQRIAALSDDDTRGAEKLADQILKSQGRIGDLNAMIARASAELDNELDQTWRGFVHTEAQNVIRACDAELRTSLNLLASLEPAHRAAIVRAQKARANLSAVELYEVQALNKVNQRRWIDTKRAELLGKPAPDETFEPPWLMDNQPPAEMILEIERGTA